MKREQLFYGSLFNIFPKQQRPGTSTASPVNPKKKFFQDIEHNKAK